MPDTCVFCGRPIDPDQERSGRPPNAAHAACADAALASDAHWDAIASASGDTASAQPPPEAGPAQERRAGPGCFMLVVPTLGVMAWLASLLAGAV